MTLIDLPLWVEVPDGDETAAALYRRHYSCHRYKDGRQNRLDNRNRFLIVGPGEKMVLLSRNYDALFVWRKFIDKCPGQTGINCAVFRNESPHLASDMILAAEQIAWRRWPEQRLYTYVNAKKVASVNPGYCFKKAGWKRCGETGKGLLIFEK